MKKQIVRRTFSIENGKPSTRIEYISKPIDAIGNEITHTDITMAYLFNHNETGYRNQVISGNDRMTGDYSYKQEVLNLKIEIENE
ncbi:MAG TPA: hypothetical protein VN026_17265 [Bacteroidia bacterium]|jgi:hypothetical protein|nr:hypothetical protein [Bacteroidia bacterium]